MTFEEFLNNVQFNKLISFFQEKCSLSLDLQVDEKWKNPGLDELSPIEEFT